MSERRVEYMLDDDRHETQCICRCGETGFTESRHHFAVMAFKEAGWKMVPTSADKRRRGYWICPECAKRLETK